MKKFILLTIISLVFSSCSNDSSDSQNDTVLLKKIIFTNGATTSTYLYTYDGNKIQSISMNNEQTIQFNYSGNLIADIKRIDSDGFVLRQSIYTYDSNQRVIKEKYIDNLNSYEDTKVFTYNTDNTIDGTVLNQSLLPTGLTGKIYLNSSGEAIKIENYSQGNLSNTTELVKDDKNNPLKNITGYNKLPGTFNQFHNNLLTKFVNSSGVEVSKSEYVYTYNSDDYVDTFQQKFYSYGVLQSTTNAQFFYE